MLPVLLLCISWSAVLCQNPPKLPEIPDEISISFISTIGKGTDTQEVSVGEIYYSKTLNKGAVVIKRKDDVEHLVFNYNTNELLVISEKDDNLCEFLDIPLLVDGNYNPEVLVSMLTNGSLKFVANETTFGDIPGNLWQGNTEGFGNTIKVTYNELNWTFSSPYTTNMNRPLSLIGINKENAVVSYYFLSTTNSVPHEAFMPPRGAFCRPFADAKQGGPTLPPAFRLDAEIYEGKIGYGSKVFYYEDAKVLREDIISAHQKHQSAIIDRNYGVVYRIDVDTGACAASPLFPKDGESKAGLLVFDNADIASFRYMGNRSCWLGDCEVWTGAKDLYMYNLYLKHSTQNQNDFIPIQLNINHNGTHQEESSMYRQYYYNFEAGYPPWEKFDVTNCYMETLRLRFQITFQGSYLGIASIPDFERSVRLAIMKLTKIPEMRMHEFRVDNMLNEFVVVTLTLLEDPRQARIKVSTSDRDLPSQNSRYSVYFQIEDAIYSDQFKVETQGQDGKPIVFLATDSTYSIMSTKNIDGKGASLVKFKIWGNMRITTTSADTLIEGVTVDACARECDSERHSTCNMFMHCKDSQQCVMSESMYQERSDKHFGSNCDLFQREFAYDYRVYPGARLQIDRTTDSSVTDETLESCFSICRKKTDGTACHSIDYCTDGKQHTCIFHAKHYVQSTHYAPDPHCLHYSQKMLKMYRPIPSKSIKDASDRYIDITYDVSASECAKNCFSDPAGCMDFEMCKPFPGTRYKSVCHVLEPKKLSTLDEKPEFIENLDCDHYRLIGVKTTFNFEYFNDTSTPAPTASAVQSSSSGYGSGSMAGLAIPMLIIAIAAGGGAVYFYIRKQRLRGNDSNYIMKFVQ